jgi:glycosyltransferase involved in cell wall biosynthesis
MRIGLEMRLVTLGGAGGIAQLLRGVLHSMFERFPQDQFVFWSTVFNRGLLGDLPANVEAVTLPLDSYFHDVGAQCVDKKVDVLFRGYPLEQLVDFPMARQVVEIPDIQHEYFPEFFDAECLRSRRAAFGRVLEGAGAIGTISEFARQSLLAQPKTRCRDIFLMCPALQVEHHQSQELTAAEQALIPSSDYFLFPANLWKHKNHRRVLAAFESCLKKMDRPVSFLFTGHPSGWEDYQKEYGHLPIRHLGFVRPVLLRRLLENARALVFFSLYEGFGMPLLEAFDAGTPVLCSNTTSLPEVGGNAVLSCDPTDIHAMSSLMTRILNEPELCHDLARRSQERLRLYTWEQSADNLMAACRRVDARAQAVSHEIFSCEPAAMPRVAIVTPSYNQGAFIRRTIESVLAQNYPNLDYVVADGGSKDDTLAILRSFGDRLKWLSEPDRGQTHAINKGFAQVQGEIHAYLNSDDILLPGAIEKAVAYLLAHPECDLVYGKAQFIDENDQPLGDYPTAHYSFERLMADCCISQPAAFWRKQIADNVGPFDESLHLAMDYDYWQRIDRAGGCLQHLPEYLAATRMHAGAKTLTQRTAVFAETIQVCKKNAGFASLNYFQGLWHYRCSESWLYSRLLKRIPCLPQTLGRLHHWWANRATYSSREFFRDSTQAFKKRLVRKLGRLTGVVRPLYHLVRRVPAGQLLAGTQPCAVKGFWGDNWMGSTFTVKLKDSPAGEHVELAGIASEPMDLTIAVNDQPIGTYGLQGQKLEEVKFQVPPGASRKVELKFSKHLVDGAGRQLSFRLQGTNLFSEQDLAA